LDLYIDNISISSPEQFDVSATKVFVENESRICLSKNTNIQVKIKNYGLQSVNNIPLKIEIDGPIKQVLLDTFKTTLANDSTIIYTLKPKANLSGYGTYIIKANTNLANDKLTFNDSLPNPDTIQNFSPISIPSIYTFDTIDKRHNTWLSNKFNPKINHGVNGGMGLYAGVSNITSSQNYIITDRFYELDDSSYLNFDYRIWGYWLPTNSFFAIELPTVDSANVFISTDCGITFSKIYSINKSNHDTSVFFKKISIPLKAFSGQKAKFKFTAKSDSLNFSPI
jgi:hypothetical protein